jgi:hypothetical protein
MLKGPRSICGKVVYGMAAREASTEAHDRTDGA